MYNADGTIDLSTENLGTFNLISPGNPLEDFGHAVLDVVPFILS